MQLFYLEMGFSFFKFKNWPERLISLITYFCGSVFIHLLCLLVTLTAVGAVSPALFPLLIGTCRF